MSIHDNNILIEIKLISISNIEEKKKNDELDNDDNDNNKLTLDYFVYLYYNHLKNFSHKSKILSFIVY